MNHDTLEFTAYQVSEHAEQPHYRGALVQRTVSELPEGEVLIRVAYSSLNYKDALSAAGNKGVTKQYPHTPGIDAAGVVVESLNAQFQAGDEVIVIGYDLGMNTAGGFGELIRVPATWLVHRPAGLSLNESMIVGTAGFTAALCVEKLLHNGLRPDQGPVLVSGASGGVGSFAVALLAQLGHEVVAMTGSAGAHDFLRELGAAQVISREQYNQPSTRPLDKELWAGAVDVAGGDCLANIIRSLKYGGSVACCGLVSSVQLPTSVLPFILRGVNLLGVDSVNLPLQQKSLLWQKLAGPWRLEALPRLETRLGLSELDSALQSLLKGSSAGRLVLKLTDDV